MTLTAAELYDRLVEQSDNEDSDFTLAADVAETDVETWLSGKDVDKLRTEADNQIERETVTDLNATVSDSHTLRDIIESHNDDPEQIEAAYVLRASKTTIQYHKPWVGGKEAINEAEADTQREEHVGKMVERAVASEILNRAKTEFGV